MNEQSAAFHRRIDPALEPPFSLGRFQVTPATLEISCDDSVRALEMRMMQVLIALHQQTGQAVSRDQLSSLCWGGRIVGDDALNRIISRLRKALSVDPAVAIDTIPKVGYRLRVNGAVQSGSRGRHWRSYRGLVVAGAVLFLVIIVGLVWTTTRREEWSAQSMRPLTREPGIEIFPALSPDGQQLAYVRGAGFGAPTDIYL
jgi:DNA-binding winged helix-turn-helix (wHTH) protein